MKMTLQQRLDYEMSFSLSERWNRAKEKVAMFIAWRCLPERVRLWVIVRQHAKLTSGEHGDRHPDTVSAFDLTKGMMK